MGAFGGRRGFFLDWLDRLKNLFARLPDVPLGLGQQRTLLEEGAHAVEFLARGGMKPAEEPHPMIAGRKDVTQGSKAKAPRQRASSEERRVGKEC